MNEQTGLSATTTSSAAATILWQPETTQRMEAARMISGYALHRSPSTI
jgi:hypothetical protein